LENRFILEMHNISKYFPGVKALDDVTFNLKKGEVHCLLGENGAGKSTLIKILSGALKLDKGEIYIKGKKVEIEKSQDSKNLGIGTIYQEMNLVPSMTVIENMFLGDEICRNISIDNREMKKKAKAVLERIKVQIRLEDLIKDLSIAKQQSVEIAKSLIFKKEILIMDEPTSSLSDKDIQELFRIIKKLKTQEVSIIYISHRLQEIPQIADRITVLRDGKVVNSVDVGEVNTSDLIEMMIGRTLEEYSVPQKKKIGKLALEVRNLSKKNKIEDISFKSYKGEILGFAGLVGSGRTELMKIIFGADKADSGEILIEGKSLKGNSIQDAIKKGVSYLSENRAVDGLVLGMTISNNITLANLSSVSKGFVIQLPKEATTSKKIIDKMRIATTSIEKIVRFLSGGNQQKVVVGKWLLTDSEILIFDEPTRGIDVGAKAEIYHLINDLADNGKSIIVVSSDLPEIMRICSRIIVMKDGKITGELENNEKTTQKEVMQFMLGDIKP